jgi:hypothetical protein
MEEKKQNFWIFRRGDPWDLVDRTTNKRVGDFPAYAYDTVDDVTYAATPEEALAIIDEWNRNQNARHVKP